MLRPCDDATTGRSASLSIRRRALSGVAIALALSLPAAAAAQEPTDEASAEVAEVENDEETGEGEITADDSSETVDAGVLRYPPSSVRLPLILGGTGLFGVAYGLTAMSSRLWPTVPGADHMLIPVAGPWVALGQSGCAPEDTDGCTLPLVFRTILLVLDGLVQAGAVGLVGEGLFMTTEAAAPDADTAARPSVEWHLAPEIGPGRTGLGVIGTF